jgi:hypothetical protein
MLIVPLRGDKITTADGPEFVVDSYTNFKTDPAVYVDVARGQNSIVYFQDIDLINGVKVEYNKASKVFTALGIVKRKYNLPQPKDSITVRNAGNQEDAENDHVLVKTAKLHSRAIGLSKGLVIQDADGGIHGLADIIDIERSVGSEHFDSKRFIKYYKDYSGAVR